jgi:hypothetical protein
MEGEISEKTRRVLKVILKAIGGLIAIGFGVYIAWYEFGTDIFSSIFFYFMMLGWLVIGIVFFI